METITDEARYCDTGCGYRLPDEYAADETTCGACENVAAIIDGSSVPREALLLFADNHHRDPADIDEDMVADAEDAYLGSAWTVREWAEEFTTDSGLLDGIPEDLRYYFDYKAWAQDGFLNGDIYMVEEPDGYKHIFHS